MSKDIVKCGDRYEHKARGLGTVVYIDNHLMKNGNACSGSIAIDWDNGHNSHMTINEFHTMLQYKIMKGAS